MKRRFGTIDPTGELQKRQDEARKRATDRSRDLAAQLARDEVRARITLPRVKFLERE